MPFEKMPFKMNVNAAEHVSKAGMLSAYQGFEHSIPMTSSSRQGIVFLADWRAAETPDKLIGSFAVALNLSAVSPEKALCEGTAPRAWPWAPFTDRCLTD
jgi:hypothetical protein